MARPMRYGKNEERLDFACYDGGAVRGILLRLNEDEEEPMFLTYYSFLDWRPLVAFKGGSVAVTRHVHTLKISRVSTTAALDRNKVDCQHSCLWPRFQPSR